MSASVNDTDVCSVCVNKVCCYSCELVVDNKFTHRLMVSVAF